MAKNHKNTSFFLSFKKCLSTTNKVVFCGCRKSPALSLSRPKIKSGRCLCQIKSKSWKHLKEIKLKKRFFHFTFTLGAGNAHSHSNYALVEFPYSALVIFLYLSLDLEVKQYSEYKNFLSASSSSVKSSTTINLKLSVAKQGKWVKWVFAPFYKISCHGC